MTDKIDNSRRKLFKLGGKATDQTSLRSGTVKQSLCIGERAEGHGNGSRNSKTTQRASSHVTRFPQKVAIA